MPGIVIVIPRSGDGPPVIDPPVVGSTSKTASADGTATSLTWSHTVASGESLFVWVTHNNSGPDNPVSGVTYGGAALTLVDSISSQPANASGRVGSLWRLASPTPGSANVVVTKSTAARIAALGLGVLRAGTVGTRNKYVSGAASVTTGTTTTTSSSNSLVLVLNTGGGATTLTPGAGGTQIDSVVSGTSLFAGAARWAGGENISQVMSGAALTQWAQMAVPIEPA